MASWYSKSFFNIDSDIKWLKNNIQPHDTVIELWKKTFAIRRRILGKADGTGKIDGYLKDFLCVSQQIGKALVN